MRSLNHGLQPTAARSAASALSFIAGGRTGGDCSCQRQVSAAAGYFFNPAIMSMPMKLRHAIATSGRTVS